MGANGGKGQIDSCKLAVRIERLWLVSPTAVGGHIHWRVGIIGRIGGDNRHCSFSAYARTHVPHAKVIERRSVIGPGMLEFSVTKKGLVSAGVVMCGCERNGIHC